MQTTVKKHRGGAPLGNQNASRGGHNVAHRKECRERAVFYLTCKDARERALAAYQDAK